ncbi:MAG: HNH endonuclease, partial [Corynebacterium casei]|nr:HNH endonuclease [Corynebacterium casei]
PANLFALCQHHHNIKTDTRAMYIVDPISDVIYWLFEDGSWVSDTAQDGPIGTGAKRWLQTFEQKIAARRKNAQDRAHELADDIDEYYTQRAEADRREQDHRDIIDELWVDDVKLAQALMREGNLHGNNPLLANDNVFMLLEAIHKLGIDLDVSDDIAPWARIQKKILEHEREENERRILKEAEKLAQELANKITKQKEQEETEQTVKVPTNPEDPPF